MTTDRGDDVDTLRPRVVGDTSRLPSIRGGSAWRLEPPTRGLDANVIDLPPGDEIRSHVGPALDVLIHILAGDGSLETDDGSIPLAVGTIVWLPPHSTRRFLAGPDGLRYFSVHQRKPGLTIASRPR